MALFGLRDCKAADEVRALFFEAARDENHDVRLSAMEELAKEPDARVVTLLILSLSDPDDGVRYGANKWLEDITQQSFGFRHTASPHMRNEAIERWDSWRKANADGFSSGAAQGKGQGKQTGTRQD